RNVIHYKIGINKTNLKAYYNELCDTLVKTKLYKSLSGSTDTDQLMKDCKDTSDVDNIKDSDSTDVWVDTRTKLVHKVRFLEDNKADNYLDILQDYQGGDVVPFGMTFNEKNGDDTVNMNMTVSLNLKNDNIDVKADVKATGSTKINGTFNLKYASTNSTTKI